ncbi:SRPBCC family protein [Williamsia muralis]|uniref:SRPBCC family protein n=1 Tax=Williamsia marianensis TaxID=85044 RepID=A0ABU4EXL0_WILMA|nr:SRPBCC family protein [Williamsia muralis]MDV7135983.1 SRPBCC family protein [Williamsia muralis]
MATTHETTASTEDVWRVLADGWSYANWVVGSSRIRAVDANWPQPGSNIAHSVGLWPVLLNDRTESVGMDEGRELRLIARALPFGKAEIILRLHEIPQGCRIEMIEHAANPPWSLMPDQIQHLAVHPRNSEALRRLALLAERSRTAE